MLIPWILYSWKILLKFWQIKRSNIFFLFYWKCSSFPLYYHHLSCLLCHLVFVPIDSFLINWQISFYRKYELWRMPTNQDKCELDVHCIHILEKEDLNQAHAIITWLYTCLSRTEWRIHVLVQKHWEFLWEDVWRNQWKKLCNGGQLLCQDNVHDHPAFSVPRT